MVPPKSLRPPVTAPTLPQGAPTESSQSGSSSSQASPPKAPLHFKRLDPPFGVPIRPLSSGGSAATNATQDSPAPLRPHPLFPSAPQSLPKRDASGSRSSVSFTPTENEPGRTDDLDSNVYLKGSKIPFSNVERDIDKKLAKLRQGVAKKPVKEPLGSKVLPTDGTTCSVASKDRITEEGADGREWTAPGSWGEEGDTWLIENHAPWPGRQGKRRHTLNIGNTQVKADSVGHDSLFALEKLSQDIAAASRFSQCVEAKNPKGPPNRPESNFEAPYVIGRFS
eukprot:GHVN01057440.1.p2 GENE.GHVN01057440.1~~GHVN01057440.1.p2  ORF type:complete len:281 (+),score=27.12 GHVN01057440.1:2427-3269(+)